MRRLNEQGFGSGLTLGLILVSVIAIIGIILSAKFYADEQKYKKNSNSLVAAAVAQEQQKEAAIKDQQFASDSQYPFFTYSGPSQYGSIHMPYPKDWSAYVDSTGGGGNPIEAYFQPGVVPAIEDQNSIFDLRMEVNSSAYSSVVSQYTNEQQSGGLSITPYALKQVPSDVGVMVQGALASNYNGVMVILPLRTNTLVIWTESMQYADLFTSQILPSVSFQP